MRKLPILKYVVLATLLSCLSAYSEVRNIVLYEGEIYKKHPTTEANALNGQTRRDNRIQAAGADVIGNNNPSNNWSDKYNENVFKFQHFCTRWIFWVGLGITLISFISAIILMFFIKPSSKNSVSADMTNGQVKIKGIGALVLAFSMTFFFLYLKYVYTITTVTIY